MDLGLTLTARGKVITVVRLMHRMLYSKATLRLISRRVAEVFGVSPWQSYEQFRGTRIPWITSSDSRDLSCSLSSCFAAVGVGAGARWPPYIKTLNYPNL
jgi:hypothetical protein